MSASCAPASASSVRLVWRPLRATSVVPFLWPSSSSSTIIGRKMSCSSKRNRHIGSCSSTLVSSTNSLAGPVDLLRLARAGGCGAATGAEGAGAGVGTRVSTCMAAGCWGALTTVAGAGTTVGAGPRSWPLRPARRPRSIAAAFRTKVVEQFQRLRAACGGVVSRAVRPERREPLCEDRAGASMRPARAMQRVSWGREAMACVRSLAESGNQKTKKPPEDQGGFVRGMRSWSSTA
jgi:hypothetical protein